MLKKAMNNDTRTTGNVTKTAAHRWFGALLATLFLAAPAAALDPTPANSSSMVYWNKVASNQGVAEWGPVGGQNVTATNMTGPSTFGFEALLVNSVDIMRFDAASIAGITSASAALSQDACMTSTLTVDATKFPEGVNVAAMQYNQLPGTAPAGTFQSDQRFRFTLFIDNGSVGSGQTYGTGQSIVSPVNKVLAPGNHTVKFCFWRDTTLSGSSGTYVNFDNPGLRLQAVQNVYLQKTWLNASPGATATITPIGTTSTTAYTSNSSSGTTTTTSTAYAINTGASFDFNEGTPPSGYVQTAKTCSVLRGDGSTVTNVSWPYAVQAGDRKLTCTISNAKAPVVRIAKNSIGGTGTFGFALTGLNATSDSIVTTTSGVAVTGAARTATVNTAVSITENSGLIIGGKTAYDTTWSCVDANAATTGNSSPSGTGTTANIPPANIKGGADYTCTFTNTKRATLRIGKQRDGTQGGPVTFTFTGTGGNLGTQNFSFNLSTSERWVKDYGTATAVQSYPGSTAPLYNLTGGVYNISEQFNDGNNNDFELTSVACKDLTDPSDAGTPGSSYTSPTIGANGGSTSITLVPGANYFCEFVNTQKPMLVVSKQVQGQGGVTFNYTISATGSGSVPPGFGLAPATNDTAQINLNIPVSSGQTRNVTVTETSPLPSGYTLISIVCNKVTKAANGTQSSGPDILGDTSTGSVTIPNFSTADTASCRYVNATSPTVVLKKISIGGTGAFSFTGGTNGLPSNLTLSPTSAGAGGVATSAPYNLTTPNAPASITESIPTGWALSDISCTSAGTSVTVTKDLNTGQLTIPGALLTGGSNVTCTFTNSVRPKIKVTKSLTGAAATFSFAYTGASTASGGTTDSLSVPANASLVTGATFYGTPGTAASIVESTSSTAVFDTSYVCTDANSAQTGNAQISSTGKSINIPASAMVTGADWTCAYTNLQRATLQIGKISTGGTGRFSFTGTNGVTGQNLDTTVSGTEVFGPIVTLAANSTSTQVSEISLPAGFALSSITCSGLGSGGVASVVNNGRAGGTVTLDAAATAPGSTIVCHFRNVNGATVSFTKAKIANDSTAVTASFAATASSNLGDVPDPITSGTTDGVAGSPSSPLLVTALNQDVRVTEVQIPGFVLTKADCENAVSGATFSATVDPATGLVTIPAANITTGAVITCQLTNTKSGTIKVIKDAIPNNTDVFEFSGTGTGVTAIFNLDDNGTETDTNPSNRTFSSLAKGQYKVTETANTAYATSVTCTGDITGGTNTASSASGNTATINLDPGENIVCTFTNSKLPTVTVHKISVGGIGTFGYTGDNGFVSDSITTTTAGQEAIGTKKVLTAASTATTITEDAPPAGYTLTSVSCTGMGTGGTAAPDLPNRKVVLNAAATAPGSDIVCTFTNTKAATLHVAKTSTGTTGTYNFTANGGVAPASFAITTATSGTPVTQTMTTVPAGADITLTELAPSPMPSPEYFLTNIACTNAPTGTTGSNLGGAGTVTNGTTEMGHITVNLVAGADVTCTFTNSVKGALNITKQTVGQSGTFNYSFSGAPAGTNPIAPTLTTDPSTNLATVQVTVPHNTQITYDLKETVNPAFQLTDIQCTSANSAAPATFSNKITTESGTTAGQITITSQPGALKNCTFINVHKPLITIKKQTVGGTGTFTLGSGTNGLEAANGVQLNTATANPYTAPTTYRITDVTKPASITETIPAGESWNTTWQCVNASNVENSSGTGTTITLDATKMQANGLDLTCTFTNTKAPKLTVVKQVVGDSGKTFNITASGAALTASQTIPLTPATDGGTAQASVPGIAPNATINLNEAASSLPAGFTLSSITCVDNANGATGSTLVNSPTLTIPANRQGGSIEGQLVPGADVTCTFKNTKNVTINLNKIAKGGNATFTFDGFLNQNAPNATPDIPGVPITTTGSGTGTFQGQFPSSGTGTFVIQERIQPNWTLTDITCTQGSPSAGTMTVDSTNLAERYIAGTVTAGAVFSCQFTNVRTPTITLAKKSIGGTATFNFTGGTNGLPASTNITTSSTNTETADATTYLVADVTKDATITESALSGWTLTGLTCRETVSETPVSITPNGSQLTIPTALLQQGKDLTCVFENTKDTKLTIAKTTGGGYGTFNIVVNQGGTTSTHPLATTAAGQTVSEVIPNVIPGTTISLTELASGFPAGWSFANAQCVDNVGGTAGSSLVSATATPNALRQGGSITGSLVTGADVTCTFTNTRNVTGKVIKKTVGGDGSFTFNAYLNASTPTGNPAAAFPLTTSGGTGEVTASFPQISTGTFVVEEAINSGYTLDSISCTTDVGSPGQLTNVSYDVVNRYMTGTVQPGTNLTCEFTNIRKPNVYVSKVTSGGTGTFGFDLTNLSATSTSVTTDAPDAAKTSAGFAVTSVDSPVTIAEQAATNWTLTTPTCVDSANNPLTVGYSNRTVTINPADLRKGLDITCTFTNKKYATLEIRKTVRNDNGGTQTAAAFQVSTSATPTVTFGAGVATGNDTLYTMAPVAVVAGTYTLSEVQVANYDNGTWSCTINGGAPAAAGTYNAGSVTLADGDVAVCSILNDDTNKANLSVTKTNNRIESVTGTTTTYVITATNNGPAKADGAILTDTPTSHLANCKIVSCSTTGGAGTCPATDTAVPTTGYSRTLTSMPAFSSMTLNVQCDVVR